MDIIKNTQEQLQITPVYELENSFIELFSELFKYNEKQIQIVGTINEPYFRAKDILEILGYENNKENIKKIIYKLDPKYKKPLSEIKGSQPLSYHEGKQLYLNEPGLYYVILHSQKEEAKRFQEYVMFNLLPSIRKRICERYTRELEGRDSKIDQLIKQNQEILDKLDNVQYELEEARDDIQYTNQELSETNQNLLDLTTVVKTKVIPNTNLKPKDPSKEHGLLFLVEEDNIITCHRATKSYIDKKLKNKSNILLSFSYPNPLDFLNKLREITNQTSKNKLSNLKESNIEYLVVRNKIYLNNITKEKFLSYIDQIKKQRDSIIEE